jgi:Domain of unknown function (DUF5666)
MNLHAVPALSGRRRLVTLSLLSLLLGMHACGGGGVEEQGTGMTPAFSQGAISGFGSIIVNGVHFDESSATVRDEDGRSLSADDLKLGMTVAIDSGTIDRVTGTAVATAITVGSELLGPVTANDPAAGTLVVLGQQVQVTASTVFDDRLVGGQAAIALGATVEVFAFYDPTRGTYTARRVEPEAGALAFHVRGQVHANNTSARTFQIGSEVFTYASGAAPADLAEGVIIRVRVQTAPNGSGQWVVTAFGAGPRQPDDGSEVEIESVIASFVSNADFTVGGLRVNASSATLEPAGAVLAAGVRVEVEGVMQAGVLVARKVAVEDDEDDGNPGGGQEYEITSRIVSVDTSSQTFVVKAGLQRISYATAVFEAGTAADLVVGQRAEIKGTLSADGTVVDASLIHFED